METRTSLDDPTPTARPLHHTASVTFINPDSKQCGEDRHEPSSTLYNAVSLCDDLDSMCITLVFFSRFQPKEGKMAICTYTSNLWTRKEHSSLHIWEGKSGTALFKGGESEPWGGRGGETNAPLPAEKTL